MNHTLASEQGHSTHRLPVDHTWDLKWQLLLHLLQCIFKILALFRAGGIAPLRNARAIQRFADVDIRDTAYHGFILDCRYFEGGELGCGHGGGSEETSR